MYFYFILVFAVFYIVFFIIFIRVVASASLDPEASLSILPMACTMLHLYLNYIVYMRLENFKKIDKINIIKPVIEFSLQIKQAVTACNNYSALHHNQHQIYLRCPIF